MTNAEVHRRMQGAANRNPWTRRRRSQKFD